MNPTELTASEALPLLRSGQLSVEAYATDLLDQTQQHSQSLNAFLAVDRAAVLAASRQADTQRANGQAQGALFGIPIALKDLIVTRDLPTTFGTAHFSGYQAERNAPLVDRLLAAGAIIIGKNNNQELAYGSNGFNAHYGQQLNPYDSARIAGGSSGGGAAAVAARMVPIALGSDTAASIRVPAAFTGLYGFRPSTGRYDLSGVWPIAPTLDTVGPLARSPKDLTLIDSVLADDFSELPKLNLRNLRLGVPQTYFQDSSSQEMRKTFEQFLGRLEQAGVTLVRADLPR
ncbi:MAG: amidase family protein, partial [Pseudomonadota bacterium]